MPIRLKYILLLLFCLAVPSFASAQSVRNEIKINTNTGGNTVNGETDGDQVTTGDTTTSINIKNNSQQTSDQDSTYHQVTNSTTDIQIESTGSGTSNVQVNLNNKKYEVTKQDGKTVVTTTDSDGNTTDRTLEDGETLRVSFEDETHITVSAANGGFQLTQNQALIQTELPVAIDLVEEKILVELNGQLVELTLLPKEMEQFVLENQLLTSRTEDFRLVSVNGQLEYQVLGQVQKRLFNIFPITIEKTVSIPIDDQQAFSETIESHWQRFLHRFSR